MRSMVEGAYGIETDFIAAPPTPLWAVPPPRFRGAGKLNGDFNMPVPRDKPSAAPNYEKRRSFADGRALVDAAHSATHRLYCDVLRFWRRCSDKSCKRHRRCAGEPTACLMRHLPLVPIAERVAAQKQVIAGGPRRIAPATHVEWQVRRAALESVASWQFW
jgi:hypothetical protein